MANWTTPKGWNFRATLAYVTDPSNTVYAGAETFPHNYSIGGETVEAGYTTGSMSLGLADRSSTAGREKLAGINYLDAVHPASKDFQITLPATGTYRFRLGMGDQAASRPVEVEVYDDATLKFSLTGLTTGGSDQWIDANGDNHTSAANWYSNNAQRSVAFSSTSCVIRFKTSASGSMCWAHVELEQTTLVTPSAGSITVSGTQPTVILSAYQVSPGAGTITLTGTQPLVSTGGLLLLGTGMDDMPNIGDMR